MNVPNMKNTSKTDWDRIGAMTDEMIDTSDIPPLSKSFFDKASLRVPKQPVSVTMHVDSDVLAWFQKHGDQYEQLMNAALRIYAEAHQE
jgi:uncharacterized protein (DUF4415 family)